MFNIFGNTGKFLAGIRDHCLKRNASAEATTDPSYKQIFFENTCLLVMNHWYLEIWYKLSV